MAEPKRRPCVAVVMPAYNASKTLEATLADIPADAADLLILGDDCSKDDTFELAQRLGLIALKTPRNLGYGGNQKMIYREALARGADIVVMLHPDNQYDARLVPHFVGFIANDTCDVILGNRVRSRRECLRGGMPFWKYLSNRMLTIGLNLTYGLNLGEYHSGFRVYRRAVLETVAFDDNTDDFGFDAQFLAQSIAHGFRVADAPMPVRYFKEASSIRFWPSVRYGLVNLKVAMQYLGHRLGLRSRMFQRRTVAD
ncbi:MAG: glycosyltransferase family 2 protein [Planctomycetota bacterium]